jgi:hypothetical protein
MIFLLVKEFTVTHDKDSFDDGYFTMVLEDGFTTG